MTLLLLLLCNLLGCSAVPTHDPHLMSNSTYRSLVVVRSGGRTLISVLTSTPDDHLLTFDPRTGERVAQTELQCQTVERSPTLLKPVGERAWVTCGDREAFVLDLATGKPLHTFDQLVASNPDLAAGFRSRLGSTDLTVDAPLVALPIALHDGRNAWLDLDGRLRFEPHPDQAAWVPGYFCWPEHKCSRNRKECLGFMKSESGIGYQLSSNRIHGERKTDPVFIGTWPVGLLKPGLVGEPGSRCAYEDEAHHLILHDSAAFEPTTSMVSRVSRDGTIAWSASYESVGADAKHQPRRALDLGDDVLLLIGNTSHKHTLRATVLDRSTGKVRSSHHLFGADPIAP